MKKPSLWRLPPKERAAATLAEMKAAAELGRTFGRRTVLAVAAPRQGYNGKRNYLIPMVLVRCACGKEDEVPWGALKTGERQRCRDCYANNLSVED